MNWSFIAGLIVGGIIGIFYMALMVVAKQGDRLMGDDHYEE